MTLTQNLSGIFVFEVLKYILDDGFVHAFSYIFFFPSEQFFLLKIEEP